MGPQYVQRRPDYDDVPRDRMPLGRWYSTQASARRKVGTEGGGERPPTVVGGRFSISIRSSNLPQGRRRVGSGTVVLMKDRRHGRLAAGMVLLLVMAAACSFERRGGDLNEIREEGVLRVIVRPGFGEWPTPLGMGGGDERVLVEHAV